MQPPLETSRVSATAATPASPRPPLVSRTRVRNQRRTTTPVARFCDAPPHGTPARLRPRLHHRPTAPAPGRRPGARRLLPGVHRDRQRRPHRPPALEQLLDQLRPGDTLVVWKLDRLGRSLRHLVDTVTGLAEGGIGFRSLQEAIDTTTPGGKLVFHVFAALAEFERDLIRERTRAGLAAARARGRRGGRPSVLSGHKLQVAQEMYASGQYSVSAIAKTLGVSRASIYRHLDASSR
jgi:Resolvase, N terminal domain/Helix-turn-helix domain of resolvase